MEQLWVCIAQCIVHSTIDYSLSEMQSYNYIAAAVLSNIVYIETVWPYLT